jgi:hypothetical protein
MNNDHRLKHCVTAPISVSRVTFIKPITVTKNHILSPSYTQAKGKLNRNGFYMKVVGQDEFPKAKKFSDNSAEHP